jgi:hypothetical protein
MKYLNNAPFSSQPANENFRNNYPFRDKFAEAVAAEKAAENSTSQSTLATSDTQEQTK